MPNSRYPWRVFWALLSATIVGDLCLLPYVLALYAKTPQPADALQTSTPVFVAVQLMHLSLIFGMAVALGLSLAPKAGLRLPLLAHWLYGGTESEARFPLRLTSGVGFLVGAFSVLLLYGVIVPRLPAWPSEAILPLWTRLLVCIYGAINEEVLMRLCVLSLVLWLLQKLCAKNGRPGPIIFWISNSLVALLYGAAYLPATATTIPLSGFVVLSVLSLKGIAGLAFGYVAWVRGLEAAMLAHFVADILLHVIGPLFAC